MILIGLNGRLHSGKDTAVEYIKDAAGPNAVVKRIGFADKLKVSAMRALGYRFDTVEEYVAAANNLKEAVRLEIHDGAVHSFTVTGREYLQWYGTEAHRDVFGDDFWVNALLPPLMTNHPSSGVQRAVANSQLSRLFPDVDVLVVTDVRFANEAERIKQYHGSIWWIDADQRLGPLSPDAHKSEYPLDSSLRSMRVPNNGSLDQFKWSVRCAYDLTVGS